MNTTSYGFEFGSMKVERLCEVRGSAVIDVKSAKANIEIQCSPSGMMTVKMGLNGPVWKLSSALAGWERII